jgi:hypothetical protein
MWLIQNLVYGQNLKKGEAHTMATAKKGGAKKAAAKKAAPKKGGAKKGGAKKR